MRGHSAFAAGGPEPGNRVVAGKYRVERIIGEGGMGVVWAATDLLLERPVALKFLREDFNSNWESAVRFVREAKAAAQLRSEHVARVIDVSVTDEGRPYIVMEYLDGQSLASMLEAHGPLPIHDAADYAIQACEGLAEAHSNGIVHRDVKPANLFLAEGSPGWRAIKILDFGISKGPHAENHDVTTGVVMGSPCYMSPEQLGGTGPIDHRADIWSLGVTLYELLTGKRAFDPSLTLPELVSSILHRPHVGLRTLRPAIPAELAAIVDRCLAKEREARFESAAAVAYALSRFAPASAAGLAERAATMAPAFPADAPASVRGPVSVRRWSDREGPVSEVRHMGQIVVAEADVVPSSARVTHRTLSLGAKVVGQSAAPGRRWFGLPMQLALAAVGACALGALAAAIVERAPAPSPSTVVLSSTPSEMPATAPSTALAPLDDRTPSAVEARLPVAAPPRTHTVEPPPASKRPAVANPDATIAAPAASAHPEPVPAEPAIPPSPLDVGPSDQKRVDPAGGRAPIRPIETKNPYRD